MRGEADWVTEQVELFDRFCEQAGEVMWRRSAGEYNNWALDIPALMNTVTTRIGAHMNDRSQHVGESQLTMMPELMDTLTVTDRRDMSLTEETQQLFEDSYNRRLDRTHVMTGAASLDPFRPLTDGKDVAHEQAIRTYQLSDDRVLPEQNTPDDPDMQC